MSDFEATGDELHTLVRLGKKRPMPFAFCPSNGEEDSLFATHRTKPPETIAKSARKASGRTKVCFGTFTVEGKLMTLVLVKELPAIAKKLKKHLRRERLPLNVQIVDLMGNELESDIEDLGDDPIDDPSDAEMADDAADVEEPSEATSASETLAENDAGEDLPDPKLLARQLKAMQPGIMALRGGAGDTLRAAMGGAVALLKAGQLVRAESTINAIDRAFSRQAALAEQQSPAEQGADQEIRQRLENLRGAAAHIGGAPHEKLTAVLAIVAKQIAAGEMTKAGQAMDAVDQAIARSKAMPAPDTPQTTGDAAKWATLSERLEPLVLATIKSGKGDTDAVKRTFFLMQEKAAAGDVASAIAMAPRLAELLKAAQTAIHTNAEAEIPANLVPFVTTRHAWIKTRTALHAEMTKLKSAMDAALRAAGGMEAALSHTGRLFDYLNTLDDRLETTLEALVTTGDGPAREGLKAKARQIIAEYNAELDSDFFRDVDGDNGFAPVKLRAPAMAALQGVSNALAA